MKGGNERFQIIGHPPTIRRDVSVGDIPPPVLRSYTHINTRITRNHERFSSAHEDHLAQSHRSIRRTSKLALTRAPEDKPRRALILGSGPCNDIPLDQLARDFESVTLVDLDAKGPQMAIAELEPHLQAKAEVVIADLSGVTGAMTTSIDSAVSRSRSYGQFVEHMIPAADQVVSHLTLPNLGSDYTFVSSQLVMSQLANIPINMMAQVIGLEYNEAYGLEEGSIDEELFFRMQMMRVAIQQAHIDHLSKLVAPEGTVHFADTYDCLDTNNGVTKTDLMVAPKLVDPVLTQHFQPTQLGTKQWTWNHTPGRRQFTVQAHSLSPLAFRI